MKFEYAPSALVVYVADKDKIKQARRNLIARYGKLIDNHWPQMHDGSRMRFIPIMHGKVKNKDVYDHLNNHLALQAVSKAGEIKLDLRIWDLQSKHDYLEGRLLEEVMHGLTSTTCEGIPVVKHITRKWSRQPDKISYKITVAPSMLSEAQHLLNTIRAALVEKFDSRVQRHFSSPHNHGTTFMGVRMKMM